MIRKEAVSKETASFVFILSLSNLYRLFRTWHPNKSLTPWELWNPWFILTRI